MRFDTRNNIFAWACEIEIGWLHHFNLSLDELACLYEILHKYVKSLLSLLQFILLSPNPHDHAKFHMTMQNLFFSLHILISLILTLVSLLAYI